MNSPLLLEVHNLACSYGRIEVLRDIEISLREGELLALIGANGAGKSTLLKAVAGLLELTRGSVVYQGKDITRLPPYQRVRLGISMVPEGRQVFTQLSVEDNLQLGGFSRVRAEMRATLEQQFARFPILKEKRAEMAGMLSGGQQQMLAIARALMAHPRLLLLDEPSMGLAPLLVEEIFGIVAELRQTGVTVLLVEQNAHGALSIADRAYVLETGNVVVEGEGRALLADEKIKTAYLGL